MYLEIIHKLCCIGCMHFKTEQTFCREENLVEDIEVNFPG